MDALKNEEKTNLDLGIPIYNVNHSSVYKRIEKDFLNRDDYSKEEVLMLCDHTYRMEILNVFGMIAFNEAEMNEKTSMLYNNCKTNEELMSCAKVLTSVENDLEVGFRLFFSYDYFYLAHKCIVEFLTNQQISKENLNNFLLKVNKNSA
uniref:Uncharacterized protein n=1 Tax=viral metagenome TaxID=1070528 RepID=A0A6C0F6M4_9ZZZZ